VAGRKKKTLFIMLIVTVLFVQSLGSVSSRVMAQGSEEIIRNGDFSQGLTDWWLDTGKTSFETTDGWATFTPLIHDDMWAQSLGQTTGALTKDVEYTFSFDAKAPEERGIEIWLRAAGSDGNTIVLSQQTLTLGEEEHYSVTFTPSEDLDSATLQIPFGGNMSSFSLKQMSIRPTTGGESGGEDPNAGGTYPLPPANTLLLNPGMEDGINNWEAWGQGFAAAGDTSHTGNASLEVLLNNGGRQVVTLQPGKSYKLGVWGKTAGTGTGTQTATVMINYKKPGDESSQSYSSFQFGQEDTDFIYKEITFVTPDDLVTEWGTQFVSIWSEGADQVFLDDFTLSEISDGDTGEEPQAPDGPQSLTGLNVDEAAVPGFDPNIHTYYYDLAAGTTVIPVVTAAAEEGNDITIEQAQELPGQAVIIVSDKADSSVWNRYIVHFRLVQPAAIDEDFETTTEGELPAGWTKNGSNSDEGTYAVASQDGSKVLKVKHDLQNSSNGLTKSFDPQTGNFTFEYRMKNTDQSAVSIIRLWDSASGQDALSLVEAWGLRFNMIGENFDSTEVPGHRIIDGDFNTNEWRNYKLIVHVPTHTYDIYLNGELKQQNIPFLGEVDQIDRLSVGHIFWSTTTTTYMDDVRMQPLPFVNNHVSNGDFSSGLDHWSISGSGAELSNDHGRGRMNIEAGQGPAVVTLGGADVAPGQSYTLRFSLRGSKPAEVNVEISGNEGEDLIKSAVIEATTAPGQYELTFTPGAGAAAPHMTSITWIINGDSSENWIGYLDNVQLLTSDAVVPLPKPAEYVAVDWIGVTDGVTELPYSGVSFKDVSVQFANESFMNLEVKYVIELRDASGEVVDRSTVQAEVSGSESTVIHAGFLIPVEASGYHIYAYAIKPEQSSAYSPVVAADVS
jgi:Carbohydrate binding domain.